MKILMVNTGIFPVPPEKGGGIETHTYYLAKALAELGNEVHYVTDVTPKAKFDCNVYIHKIHTPPLPFQANFYEWILNHIIGEMLAYKSAFLTLIREREFDVLHFHGKLSALIFTCTRFLCTNNTPLIYTVHDPTPWMCNYETFVEREVRKIVYRVVEYKIWQNVEHIISVSERIKDELIKYWQIPNDKVTVIPNGVDIDAFKPRIKWEDLQEKNFGIPDNYILFVGQLRKRKGVHYLLHALAELGDLNLVVVGGGPEYDNLKELARKLKVEKNTFFMGSVSFSDLQKLYSGAQFFVLPSIAEGLPLVILEAMASGLPVIATNVSGIREVIKHGYNGFIVPPRDIRALRDYIDLLVKDDGLRQKMAKKARETVIKRFSWLSIAKKTLAVYKRVADYGDNPL